MENSIRLSIPQPCSEKWENFTPNNAGGFCGSCQKTVIDFTKMTDNEVLQFLKTKPAHACGRFRSGQLKEYREIPMYSIKPSRMLLRAGMLSLLLALIGKPTFAQRTVDPVKKEIVQNVRHENGIFVVRGTVVDEDNNPMPGVNIVLRGTTAGTVSDADGKFQFPEELKTGDRLVFSFIGYITADFVIDANNASNLSVIMSADLQILGEVIMMGAVAVEEPVPQKKFIKTWFASLRDRF